MRLVLIILTSLMIFHAVESRAEPVRGAYPSANVQFLPAFVAL